MKIRVTDNWKQSWKWISVHCMALSAALSTLSTCIIVQWGSLPHEWQQIILQYYSTPLMFKIIAGLSIFGIIGRYIKQSKDV